ncbi:LLM class F420-dependent oxidoreductase [Pseudonocardia sp. ICBG1122]|nr:LLM class F420-dependent oxidoreductase [Pseudonocardia pini]
MGTRLGFQLSNFTYPGGVTELFPTVVAQAREAEQAGFDTVFLSDHVHQLPNGGGADQPMPEAYSTLGALATATSTVQLSALVSGNTFRNPAMLAKTVTTLDVVSGGRALLGIGAGWHEPEHHAYGWEFGTAAQRFDRLDEALQIIVPMLRGERPTVDGRWYRASAATNEPRLRDDLPVLLGGGGERRTFALAARYAQHLNILCDLGELPRKLDALAQRCAEAGRDRSTLETSYLAFVLVDENGDTARRRQRDLMRGMGVDLDALSPEDRAKVTAGQFVGDPDEVASALQEQVLDLGVDGVVVNMAATGHEPGAIDLAGRTLRRLLG